MKIKQLAFVVAGLAFSGAALSAPVTNFDTRFNVTAEVPDGVLITDPDGNPVTELDIRLTPGGSGHASATNTMSADTLKVKSLRLWSNNVSDLKVKLTLDDQYASTGSPFQLNSTTGGQLNKIPFTVATIESGAAKQTFVNSGDSKNYNMTAVGSGATGHTEKEVAFVFESTSAYNTYAAGGYSGVVYANVAVAP